MSRRLINYGANDHEAHRVGDKFLLAIWSTREGRGARAAATARGWMGSKNTNARTLA